MTGIINYGLGNTVAVHNMLNRIGVKNIIINTPLELKNAKNLILTGVGSFDRGISLLKEKGFFDEIINAVKSENKKIMGICLGMQMLFLRSEEGNIQGLGLIDSEVVRFNPTNMGSERVPHFGWNDIIMSNPNSKLLNGFENEARFYFAHSYHASINTSKEIVSGETSHGYIFPSVIENGNIMGVQFHPEKSHNFGKKLLKNFSELK